MNDVTKYTPGQMVPAVDGAHADILANHAAADALVGRLMAMPVQRPRDHEAVLQRLRFLAETAGDDFFYSWPVKLKDGKKGEVSGPSIELAMGVANAAGNCGYVTTHIVLPDAFVITAFFVDRENGTVHARQFRQRREQRTFGGKRKDEDVARQEDLAFQIGQSKAIRNVIVRALRPYVDFAMREARRVLIETATKAPDQYKARVCERLAELNVPLARVASWVGRGPERWEPVDLVKIAAVLSAIGEQLTTADDIWPDPELAAGPPPAPRPARREDPPLAEPPHGMPDPSTVDAPDPDQAA